MRAPSEDLFRLVKAMNKGEKRNFKLMAGMLTGDKKYTDLFDQVDRQVVYDESKILKTGIRQGQLSVAKNYLFKYLLKSLVYLKSDSFSELVQMNEQVRILLSKHLYTEARKLLKKALRQAKILEAFKVQLDLLDLQTQLLMAMVNEKNRTSRLVEIYEEKVAVLQEICYLEELDHLHNQIKLYQNSRLKIKGSVDQGILSEISDHEVLQKGEPNSSVRAKLIYLKIIRKLYSYQGKPEQAATHCQRILETYEASETLLASELGDYFLELSNLCTYLFRSGQNKKSLELMDQFLKARKKYKNSDLEFFQRYYILQFAYAIHTGNPQYGYDFLNGLNEDLVTIQKKIPSAHLKWLYYLVTYLFFIDGKPKEAGEWLKKFFEIPNSDYLKDLPVYARLLKLLILFDLKEFTVLETETVNVQKFLEREGNFSPYEHEIVRTVKQLIRSLGFGQDSAVYKKALENFQHEIQQNENLAPLEILNFEMWLQHKVAKKKIAELIRDEPFNQ